MLLEWFSSFFKNILLIEKKVEPQKVKGVQKL